MRRPRYSGRGYREPRPGRWDFSRFPISENAVGTVRDCPETGGSVHYSQCLHCPQYRVWEEGDVQLCRHEYERLKERGFYAKTEEEWLQHVHEADPSAWERLVREKENRERVVGEIEAEERQREAERRFDPWGEEEAGPGDEDDEDDEDEEEELWR